MKCFKIDQNDQSSDEQRSREEQRRINERRSKKVCDVYVLLEFYSFVRQRLVREAQIMSELRHDNVLPVFGYGRLPSDKIDYVNYALVYPAFKTGCLSNYWKNNVLSEHSKVKIVSSLSFNLYVPKKFNDRHLK